MVYIGKNVTDINKKMSSKENIPPVLYFARVNMICAKNKLEEMLQQYCAELDNCIVPDHALQRVEDGAKVIISGYAGRAARPAIRWDKIGSRFEHRRLPVCDSCYISFTRVKRMI